LSPTCFDERTTFGTPDGVKGVSALSVGSFVSTAGGYTQVMDNYYIPGDHAKVEMHLESDDVLVVTNSHWMLAGNDSNSLVPLPASAVEVGMAIQVEDGTFPEVKTIKRVVTPGKWALSTSSCTAYANKVLTGTVCGNTTSDFFLRALSQARAHSSSA